MLRLPIDDPHWGEVLPPVPTGFEVTVSFSSPALAGEHGEAVELLGYTPVGCHGGHVPSAMLLITQPLIEAYPKYWRHLAGRADAAYSLALGPPVRLLGDVLRLHVGGAGTD
jgi:hypothetical protein